MSRKIDPITVAGLTKIFSENVRKTKKCWHWLGTNPPTKGPIIIWTKTNKRWANGKVKYDIYSARAVSLIINGREPQGKNRVISICKNKSCVNPDHLSCGDTPKHLLPKKARCPACKKWKPLSAYHNTTGRKSSHNPYCKLCTNDYNKKRYNDNPSIKKKQMASAKKLVIRNKQFIYEYLSKHPCIDCGETNPIVLEFDHTSGNKVMDLCKMTGSPYSLEKIEQEIAKCQVRCANCHRKKTWKQLSWGKDWYHPTI